MPQPSLEASAPLRALVLIAVAGTLLGDLVLVTLWAVGRARGRPFFAPQWSVADLFLGLQAVVGSTAAVTLVWMLIVALRHPGAFRPDGPGGLSPALLYRVVIPAFVFQQIALIAVPALVVRFRYRLQPAAALGLQAARSPVWRSLLHGALAAALLLPVADLVETLCRRWLLDPGRIPFAAALKDLAEGANPLAYLAPFRSEPGALLIAAGLVGIVGPVAEEVFFRGFAYQVLRRRFGRGAGAPLSALLFAAIHANPVTLLPIFMIGLVLAWLFERTGSLAAPIGLHCANNLLALAVYLLAPEFSLWGPFLPK